VLNDGLKKINQSSFQYCSSLQSITIPSTVNEIEQFAFYECTNLREVVLNDGIKRIKSRVFQDCTSLEHITIPSAITCIEQYAFTNCRRLSEVTIANNEVQIVHRAFDECSSLMWFKFPILFTRLENIIRAGQRDIEAKMDDISAIEWRDGELSIPPVVRRIGSPLGGMETLVEVDKEKLDKIVRLIRHYEIKEATTLFELALWKARIDQAVGASADRGACRIEVPGPVKDTILQYLQS